MRDTLITESIVEHVQQRLSQGLLRDRLRALMDAEPDLHYAVNRFAACALDDLEGLPDGAQDRAHDAVWRAVLLALGCYHHAYGELCRDPELEWILRQLDPTLLGGPESAHASYGAQPDPGTTAVEDRGWIETPDAVVDARPPRRRREGTPEMLVTAADLRRAAAAVRRQGRVATLEYWRDREPVLTRHLVDGCRDVYRQLLLRQGGPARDAALLHAVDEVVLAGFAAWAGGQYRLWADTAMGDRLAQFDPRLADDPPGDGPR